METADTRPLWRTITWLLCVCTGGAIAGGCLLALLGAWANAPSWGSVQGSVISAYVGTQETTGRTLGRNSRTYRYTQYVPEIFYRYQVGGRVYDGDGIGDGTHYNYDSRDGALAALAPYMRGPLTVYYDRSNPERSALDTGIWTRIYLYVGGGGLLLMVVGFALRGIAAAVEAPSDDDAPPPEEETGFAQQR